MAKKVTKIAGKFDNMTDDSLAERAREVTNALTSQNGKISETEGILQEYINHRNDLLDSKEELEKEMTKRGILDFSSRMQKKYGKELTDKQWSKVYRKAWEDGHSYGENEVENELIELVELFED